MKYFLICFLLIFLIKIALTVYEGQTFYEILEVNEDATDDYIKKAYRRIVLKVHPDKNKEDPVAKDKFQKLNEAYQTLIDPIKRLDYNNDLRNKRKSALGYASTSQQSKGKGEGNHSKEAREANLNLIVFENKIIVQEANGQKYQTNNLTIKGNLNKINIYGNYIAYPPYGDIIISDLVSINFYGPNRIEKGNKQYKPVNENEFNYIRKRRDSYFIQNHVNHIEIIIDDKQIATFKNAIHIFGQAFVKIHGSYIHTPDPHTETNKGSSSSNQYGSTSQNYWNFGRPQQQEMPRPPPQQEMPRHPPPQQGIPFSPFPPQPQQEMSWPFNGQSFKSHMEQQGVGWPFNGQSFQSHMQQQGIPWPPPPRQNSNNVPLSFNIINGKYYINGREVTEQEFYQATSRN